jgi:hypothetical protein
MDLTRSIRDKMIAERLMLVYRGDVTNENYIPLLMLLEKEMENSDFEFIGRKRLFMFVLESLQNVSRYSDQSQLADMSLVVYSKTDTGYTVTTANALPADKISGLKSNLDVINNLQPEEIRKVYRQMLSEAEYNDKGGAGLGLIEMARRTGNKLDYDFVPLDEKFSYFILSKTVNSAAQGGNSGKTGSSFHSVDISNLERIMADNNIYFIWSGHLSTDVENEVLTFTETRLAEEDIEMSLRRRIFGVLVEILGNVAMYSPGKKAEQQFGMPVAIIKVEQEEYSLTTGNLINNGDVDDLKIKLELINNFDDIGLKELFRSSLSGQNKDSKSTGNLGLIDMAMKSGSKLVYQFEKINDLYSYFSLTVKVEDKNLK